VADNALIDGITDGSPKGRSPRAIGFDERRHTLHAPFSKHLLDPSHEFAGDASTPIVGVHHQSIHIPAPPVESPEQCSDYLVSIKGQHEDCGSVRDDGTYLRDPIGKTEARTGCLPQKKD
jgi:hypothetical protein